MTATAPAPSAKENQSSAASSERPQSHVESSDMENGHSNDPEKAFEPLRSITNTRRNGDVTVHKTPSRTSRRSLEQTWSLNDGFSVNEPDEEDQEKGEEAGAVPPEESAFTVGWDVNDPENPRNMNKIRKWIIVVICSIGSVCV